MSVPAVTGQWRASDVTAHAHNVVLVAGDVAHVSVKPHVTLHTHTQTHRHIRPAVQVPTVLGRNGRRLYASNLCVKATPPPSKISYRHGNGKENKFYHIGL